MRLRQNAAVSGEGRDNILQVGAAGHGVQSAKTPEHGSITVECLKLAVEAPDDHSETSVLKSIQPVFLHASAIEERQQQPYEMHFVNKRYSLEATESQNGLRLSAVLIIEPSRNGFAV